MSNRGPVDPRLLRYAGAARGYLVVTVVLGLAGTVLILAQAGLLAHALAAAARGDVAATLAGTLTILLIVVAARAAVSYGGEVTALRAALRNVSCRSNARAAEASCNTSRTAPGSSGKGEPCTVMPCLFSRGLSTDRS